MKKNHKSKSIRTILSAVILVAISATAFIAFTSKPTQAAWFNDTFSHRRPITFTNSGAADTNKRVKLDVDTAAEITANRMQSDCDDVRFTDSQGAKLRYYADFATGACNTSSSDFWILMPSIPVGENLVYIYFGNSQVSTETEAAQFNESQFSATVTVSSTLGQTPSPMIYWKFDESIGSTAEDNTQNNNDGSLNNSPTYQPFDKCISNGCLQFDGSNDHVSRSFGTDNELTPGTGGITISMWFKHTSTISGTDNLFARFSSGGMKIYYSSGNFCFGIDDDGTSFPSDSACDTTNSYADSQWHQVVAVKNGTSNIKLYIDGREVASDNTITSSSISGSSPSFRIGIDNDGTSNPWDGFIDEVKYFTFAKTASQVAAEYGSKGTSKGVSARFSGPESETLSEGLVGYWKMDESAANSCTGGSNDSCDSSGNANDGAWNGSTTVGTQSKFGQATNFDGVDDYISIPSLLGSPSSITLSVWGRLVSADTIGSDIIGIDSAVTIRLDSAGECLGIFYDGSTYNTTPVTKSVAGTGWHHFAYTVDAAAKTQVLYIDGVAVAFGAITTAISYSGSSNTIIGRQGNAATTADFNGQIDDARIYNRALSKNEIEQLYNWEPEPVSWWKIDDNINDTLVNSAIGGSTSNSFTGTVTWRRGIYGAAINFQGSDEVVRIPEWTNVDIGATTDSLTVEGWINTTTNYGANGGAIIAKWDNAGGTNNYPYRLYVNSSEQACFQISDATNAPSACSTATVNSGTWRHIVGVRDVTADTIYLYVDGVLTTSTADSTTATTANDDNLSIGNSGTTYTLNDFNGQIDDVRIYNYARSAKSISRDMNGDHGNINLGPGSLVGYYNMDDPSLATALDKSGKGNTLTASTTSWTLAGKANTAWNGVGTNRITRADDSDFDFVANEDFTISGWFKSDSSTNPASDESIFEKIESSAGYSIFIDTSGRVSFVIDDDTTYDPDDFATTNEDFYDNSWHHFAAVKTSTKLGVYIDGVLKASDTSLIATGSLANATTLTIGDGNTSDDGDEFNGDLDELKVYRVALTQNEIQSDYNMGATASLGNVFDHSYEDVGGVTPVLHYRFDDNTGTTPDDYSGSNSDINANNGFTWINGKSGYGSAVRFDGANDVVRRSEVANFDLGATSSSYSLIAWFKTSTNYAGDAFIAAKSTTATTAGTYPYNIYMNSSEQVCFTLRDGTFQPNTCTTSSYNDDKWHQAVGVRSNTTGRIYIYVDGLLINSTSDTTSSSSVNNANLSIGNGGDASYIANDFTGDIDDVKFFDYALSNAQVAYHYNRGEPFGWYRMDQCQSDQTYNSAKTGNNEAYGSHGTITIGASGTNTAVGSCESGNSAHAWYNGRNGKYNSALDLDGTDDYVQISGLLNTPTNMSLSAWVDLDTADSTGAEVISLGNYVVLEADASSGDGVNGYYYIGSGTWNTTASNLNIAGTGWHLITYVLDDINNVQSIYVDGKIRGTNAYSQSITWTGLGSNTFIGKGGNGSTTVDFNGRVDDLRIYAYPLNQGQINKLYNEGAAVRFGPVTGTP